MDGADVSTLSPLDNGGDRSLLSQAQAAIERGNFICAIELLLPISARARGNHEAWRMLVDAYTGDGNRESPLRPFELAHQDEALLGRASATHVLGLRCVQVDAVRAQAYLESALKSLRALAEKGESRAMGALGIAYRGGMGVPRDTARAVAWLTLAFENGGYGEANNLCLIYADDMPRTAENMEKARYWYWKTKQHNCQCIRFSQFEEMGPPPEVARG